MYIMSIGKKKSLAGPPLEISIEVTELKLCVVLGQLVKLINNLVFNWILLLKFN